MARRAAVKTEAPPLPKKRASRSTTPNPETLSALGADTLIRLVLEETRLNAPFRKRVSAALAGLQGADAVAALVDRRLSALEKARGFIDWQKRRTFAADLAAMLATIMTDLRPLDPGMALERLVRFLAGASQTLERIDDANGAVHGLYEDAAGFAGEIASELGPERAAGFADSLVPRVERDAFGFVTQVLLDLVPRLPAEALAGLDARFAAALTALPAPKAVTPARGFAADDGAWGLRMTRTRLTRMRQALADARGDVDAFVALEREGSERPDAAAIAERLLAAGRAQEALDWVRRPAKRGLVVVTREDLILGTFDRDTPDRRREDVEIAALDALGRGEEAQAKRWARFERGLDPGALRDHLARLPDFEDEEALERAFAYAEAREDPHGSLYFLIRWPDPARAARLVLARRGEWEGRYWELLSPAAEALEADHPLAASLITRVLLDDILARARSAAYGHAARHLARLDALARELEPGQLSPDHDAYREGLRTAHGRKRAFWDQVEG